MKRASPSMMLFAGGPPSFLGGRALENRGFPQRECRNFLKTIKASCELIPEWLLYKSRFSHDGNEQILIWIDPYCLSMPLLLLATH